MLVTLTTGLTEHYDDEPFSQGGQGTLHLSRDGRWVIKLYHQGDQRRIPGLNKIIDDLNVTKSDPSVASLFAWPDAIVRAPRLGIRMPNVNQQIEHKPLTWWILPKALKHLPPDMRGTWLDRIYVAVNMARIAWQLHAYGLCHSDFSGDNFLANVARHHTVLIDLDSLVVPGVLLPEMLGTGDYMAPEIVSGRLKPAGKGAGKDEGAKPSIYTDLHSLAVLIYQLLLMRHPLKGPKKYADDAETDDLLALGPRALYIENADDPSNRPVGPFNGSWLLGEEVRDVDAPRVYRRAAQPDATPAGSRVGRRADPHDRTDRALREPGLRGQGVCTAPGSTGGLSLVRDEGATTRAGAGFADVRRGRAGRTLPAGPGPSRRLAAAHPAPLARAGRVFGALGGHCRGSPPLKMGSS
jgi:hypothetical protein